MTAETAARDVDVAALGRLEQAATPGPWRVGAITGRSIDDQEQELAYLITASLPWADVNVSALVAEVPDRDKD